MQSLTRIQLAHALARIAFNSSKKTTSCENLNFDYWLEHYLQYETADLNEEYAYQQELS